MKLMACVFVAMTMLAGAAQAGDWRVVSNNERMASLTDISTIRTMPNGKKQVWSTTIFARPIEEAIDYVKTLEEFDCPRRETSVLATYGYNADGLFLGSEVQEKPAEPVIPDSNGEMVFAAICEGDKILESRPRFDTVGEAATFWREKILK